MQNNRLVLTMSMGLGMSMGMVLVLAACSSNAMRPDFGVSTHHNATVQLVDSGAEGRVRPPATVDGEKLEKGLARYRTDRPDASRDKLVKTGN